MREFEVTVLKVVGNVTAAGVTGSWVDLQGIVGFGHREVKVVLAAGPGTTAGTAGGYVQTASDTSGTAVATLATFDTQTSAGGFDEQHGVIPAANRYARFIGSVQSGKDMDLGCILIAPNRYSP